MRKNIFNYSFACMLIFTILTMSLTSNIAFADSSTVSEDTTVYSCYIQKKMGKDYFDIHDAFDISDWTLRPGLCAYPSDNTKDYQWILDRGNDALNEFNIGENSDLYTVDTSEVDITTPGVYNVYIRPNSGKTGSFISKEKKEYAFVMSDLECVVEIQVVDKDADMKDISKVEVITPKNMTDCFNGKKDETFYMQINHISGVELDYSITDTEVAAIIDLQKYEYADSLTVKLAKEGSTELIITNAVGEKLTYPITVKNNEENFNFNTICLQGYCGDTIAFSFFYGNHSADDIVFTVEDESIFELSDKKTNNSDGLVLQGKFINTGSTIIKAVAPDGKTVSVDINALVATTTSTVTTKIVTTTTVHEDNQTTTSSTTTSPHYDYYAKLEYDDSPMKIGETRKVVMSNPVLGSLRDMKVRTISNNIVYEYEKGNDYFMITALSEGNAYMVIEAEGCTLGGELSIDVEKSSLPQTGVTGTRLPEAIAVTLLLGGTAIIYVSRRKID